MKTSIRMMSGTKDSFSKYFFYDFFWKGASREEGGEGGNAVQCGEEGWYMETEN